MDGDRTLSVTEAAKAMGLTPDAVRHRVRRGTLVGYRQGGQLRVVVPSCPADDPPTTGQRQDETGQTARPEIEALVEALQEQIEYLRRKLDASEAERADLRRLVSQEQSNVNRLLLQLQPAPATEAAPKRRRWWWPWGKD